MNPPAASEPVAINGSATPDARLLTERGKTALAAGDAETALADAEAARKADPEYPQATVLKAQALARLGRTEDAVDLLHEAIAAHEHQRLIRFARTFVHEHGRPDRALDYALRLVDLEPDDEKNRAFLGQMFLALDAPETALVHAEAMLASGSLKLGPMLKAQVLVKLDRRQEALSVLRTAVAAQDDDPKILRMARTIAFENGAHAEAIDYALRLAKLEPDQPGNQAVIVQSHLASGQFEQALACAQELLSRHPADDDGTMLAAQALVALHRIDDALALLGSALEGRSSVKLLRAARSMALQHGRFDAAIEYSRALLAGTPDDETNHVFLVQAYIASGRIAEADEHLANAGTGRDFRSLKKMQFYRRHSRELENSSPAVVQAWRAALDNRGTDAPAKQAQGSCDATMIQYWSQGALPADVAIVHRCWQELFDREALGAVELFDRNSASGWIDAHAPEFSPAFAQSFHYAMESDIFRIAYASKRPCIYMDIDSWPLGDAADILRFGVQNRATMLYLRAYRPWVLNGFFISTPESAFVRELVRQTLEVRVDELPKNHETIEQSFGPSRYNKVLQDFVQRTSESTAEAVPQLAGCSSLSLGEERIYFTHEAAVASVKPPFALGYKSTDDYWKGVSIQS